MHVKTLMIFSAKWCVPCRSMKAQLEEVILPVDEVLNIDVDECNEQARDWNIRGVPTLILLEDRVEIKRTSGFQGSTKLVEFCTT